MHRFIIWAYTYHAKMVKQMVMTWNVIETTTIIKSLTSFHKQIPMLWLITYDSYHMTHKIWVIVYDAWIIVLIK